MHNITLSLNLKMIYRVRELGLKERNNIKIGLKYELNSSG
jgi:hypothetical protein